MNHLRPKFQSNITPLCHEISGIRAQCTSKTFVPGGQIIQESRPLITPPLQHLLGSVSSQQVHTQDGENLAHAVKNEDATIEMVIDEDGQPKEKRVVNYWSKKQRLNKTLNKIKPKSSMAILNEILKNVTYEVNSIPNSMFRATVSINGEVFTGEGKSKALAQTAAAEEALKHMVLTSPNNSDEDLSVGHSHLLSYALYKLLNSWDVSGNMVTKMQQATSLKSTVVVNPTKKFPANPEKVHPVMLLSQTHPTAEFKEIACTPPPNTSFTIQVTVNDHHFTGTATKKRDAKRNAAKLACMEVLGIKYDD